MAFTVNAEMLDFCVLGILQRQDEYGYSITQKFREHFDISESTLYPVLRRLRKADCLATYDRQYQGRNRRYYKITDEGLRQLERYRGDWEKHKTIIDGMTAEKGKNA